MRRLRGRAGSRVAYRHAPQQRVGPEGAPQYHDQGMAALLADLTIRIPTAVVETEIAVLEVIINLRS